jgi:type II secretory pathway predicted ATPase ExeA
MAMTQEEARGIVAALRTGAVPGRGLHHFATGVEPLMRVVEEELDEVGRGGGTGRAKWVRGPYGSGKTFLTRLLCARAQERHFATAEVQISINDTPLHHLETVYRRLVERLATPAEGAGAFRAVVDGWLYHVGEEVTRLKGLTEDDPAFPREVEARLEDKLAELSRRTPAYAQVLRAYAAAVQEGALGEAQQLLGWLGGQPHVERRVLARAGVKGAVDGQAALAFLQGLLLLLRQSGHQGLVVVLDEVETVQRMPAPTRDKALNALRQLVDMLVNGELPGLYLVVTGTPELFEGPKGVKSLAPLYQRVFTRFDTEPRFDNLRAPQVRLPPFDAQRLLEVGRRVRTLFPAREPARVLATVDERFLEGLVAQVTQGFGGRVEVAPRLFLRELVDVMDRVDQFPDYSPHQHYRLEVEEASLRPEELAARRGVELVAEAPAGPSGLPARRLEG